MEYVPGLPACTGGGQCGDRRLFSDGAGRYRDAFFGNGSRRAAENGAAARFCRADQRRSVAQPVVGDGIQRPDVDAGRPQLRFDRRAESYRDGCDRRPDQRDLPECQPKYGNGNGYAGGDPRCVVAVQRIREIHR